MVHESLKLCPLFSRAPSISSPLVDWHTGYKVGNFINNFSYHSNKTYGRVAQCVVIGELIIEVVHIVEDQETEQGQNQGAYNFQSPSTNNRLELIL